MAHFQGYSNEFSDDVYIAELEDDSMSLSSLLTSDKLPGDQERPVSVSTAQREQSPSLIADGCEGNSVDTGIPCPTTGPQQKGVRVDRDDNVGRFHPAEHYRGAQFSGPTHLDHVELGSGRNTYGRNNTELDWGRNNAELDLGSNYTASDQRRDKIELGWGSDDRGLIAGGSIWAPSPSDPPVTASRHVAAQQKMECEAGWKQSGLDINLDSSHLPSLDSGKSWYHQQKSCLFVEPSHINQSQTSPQPSAPMASSQVSSLTDYQLQRYLPTDVSNIFQFDEGDRRRVDETGDRLTDDSDLLFLEDFMDSLNLLELSLEKDKLRAPSVAMASELSHLSNQVSSELSPVPLDCISNFAADKMSSELSHVPSDSASSEVTQGQQGQRRNGSANRNNYFSPPSTSRLGQMAQQGPWSNPTSPAEFSTSAEELLLCPSSRQVGSLVDVFGQLGLATQAANHPARDRNAFGDLSQFVVPDTLHSTATDTSSNLTRESEAAAPAILASGRGSLHREYQSGDLTQTNKSATDMSSNLSSNLIRGNETAAPARGSLHREYQSGDLTQTKKLAAPETIPTTATETPSDPTREREAAATARPVPGRGTGSLQREYQTGDLTQENKSAAREDNGSLTWDGLENVGSLSVGPACGDDFSALSSAYAGDIGSSVARPEVADAGDIGCSVARPEVADAGDIGSSVARPEVADAGDIGSSVARPEVADAGDIGSSVARPEVADAGDIGSSVARPEVADAGDIGSSVADAGDIGSSVARPEVADAGDIGSSVARPEVADACDIGSSVARPEVADGTSGALSTIGGKSERQTSTAMDWASAVFRMPSHALSAEYVTGSPRRVSSGCLQATGSSGCLQATPSAGGTLGCSDWGGMSPQDGQLCSPHQGQTYTEMDINLEEFERTSLFEEAQDILFSAEGGRVLLTGVPGSGKRSLARALLRHAEQVKKIPCRVIKTFQEWRECAGGFQSQKPSAQASQVLLLDHVFGRAALREVELWRGVFEVMTSLCRQGRVLLVFTFYPHVLRALREAVPGCDLVQTCQVTMTPLEREEKASMLRGHMTRLSVPNEELDSLREELVEFVLEIDDSGAMFPACCARVVDLIRSYIPLSDPEDDSASFRRHLSACCKIFSRPAPLYKDFFCEVAHEESQCQEELYAAFALLLAGVSLTGTENLDDRCRSLGFSSACSRVRLLGMLRRFRGTLVTEDCQRFVNRHAYEGTALALAEPHAQIVVAVVDWEFLIKRCVVPLKSAVVHACVRPYVLEVRRVTPDRKKCGPEYCALVKRIAEGLSSPTEALFALQHEALRTVEFCQDLGDGARIMNVRSASLLYWSLFNESSTYFEWILKNLGKRRLHSEEDLMLAASACCVLRGKSECLQTLLRYWTKVTSQNLTSEDLRLFLQGSAVIKTPTLSMPVPRSAESFSQAWKTQLQHLKSVSEEDTPQIEHNTTLELAGTQQPVEHLASWSSESSSNLTRWRPNHRLQTRQRGASALTPGDGGRRGHTHVSVDQSPLFLAVRYNNPDVVDVLAENFPDSLTLADHNGRTGLHLAALYPDRADVARKLLRCPGLVSATDLLGNSALHYACLKGHEGVVRLLMEKDASLMSVSNRLGKTPRDFAIEQGCHHLLNSLR